MASESKWKYQNPNLEPEDIPMYVAKSGEEAVIELPKGDRRSDFDEGFGELEDLFIKYRKAQKDTKRLKEQINRVLEDILNVLNVRDDDGSVQNLLDILEREGVALEGRLQKIIALQDLTIRIQSKEGQLTISKAVERVSHATAWKKLYEALTIINESNDESRGSQAALLDLMDEILSKTKSKRDVGFMSGRFLSGMQRFRNRKIQQEATSVGETVAYIWNRIKSAASKLANQIRKGTEKWFSKSRKIDQIIRSVEVQLQEAYKGEGNMINEKFENPRLTRSGFETDIDDDSHEIRIEIPKHRRSHYDEKMEAAEGVQNEIRGVEDKIKKLKSKVKKLKDEADEALNVLDDDGQARSLLEVLEENEQDLIEIGGQVEKFADLTIRISSNKFIRTFSKVPEKGPDYKAVVDQVLIFLQSVDSAATQNSELIGYIESLIEETKRNAKAKKRSDLGVKKLDESLLYEFQVMQGLRKFWAGVKSKVSMLIRKMKGMHRQWNQLGDELNMIMRDVLPNDIRSIEEGRIISESSTRKYTIEEMGEEGPCPQCGYQLYIGDEAYELTDGSESGFCCKKCVEGFLKEE